MNNYERVQKSVDFMEEHLKEPVTLDEIAWVTCFSLPHFYRLFNALAGRTIKDYLRLRRLSEAAKEVASTGRSILDIALDYQFQSQESFTRPVHQGGPPAWTVPRRVLPDLRRESRAGRLGCPHGRKRGLLGQDNRVMGKHQWLEEHLNLEEQGTTGFHKGLRMRLYCPAAE